MRLKWKSGSLRATALSLQSFYVIFTAIADSPN